MKVACGELWSCHCTLGWVTEQVPISKKRKEKRVLGQGGLRAGRHAEKVINTVDLSARQVEVFL